ncbi:MAG: M42 family metallopeptidase [Lentisphaerae bacterium]|nr:M42 family metallopeptidase [Lentisphaerota bacterium]
MNECLRQLVETFGPSGHEHRVRALIADLVGGHVDELRTDAMGNLVALKRGDGTGQRLMLAAHMDEIGLMASYIDEKGFVRVQPIGGVSPWLEVGGRVQFQNGSLGVVSHDKLGHGEAVPPMEKLFIDVGAASRQDCPVGLGDVACFVQPMVQVGGLLTAKAMDDRVGCAVLIETLRRLAATPHDCYVVFSAQEEVGTRGAVTAAYGVAPDVGLAVDVTLAGDVPEPAVRMATALGAGPAIKVKDGGMIATPWVKDWMIDVAQAEGLPWQLEVLPGGTTDARAIQTSRDGVPAGCLSIPCRYVHSPSETVSPADLGHAVDLLVAMLRRPLPR